MTIQKKKRGVLDPNDPLSEEIKLIDEGAKKAAKLSRMYFNQNTQAAIVTYQQTPDKKEKNRVYEQDIMPAFEKLAENLINIHKFTSLHDTYDDLKNDCVNFLFETIHKFDGTRGTNAFSYFNVVAKNWLIVRTKQKAQRIKRTISLDDPDALSANEFKIIDEQSTSFPQDYAHSDEFQPSMILEILNEIRCKAKSENELACINSIITIFENAGHVDLLNKGAILLYMRELSGLSPKQLTSTMQMVKKHYRKVKIESKYQIF
jgi:hypothetical protein